MEILKVKNIKISPESIRSAIASLDDAIALHTEMKGHFEEILALQSGSRALDHQPRRGRRRRGGKTLREAILEVLSKKRGPMKPVDLRNEILRSGYTTAMGLQSFYTAVFNTARKEPGVRKTADGFELKTGATTSGSKTAKAKKKKTAKKKKRAASKRRRSAKKRKKKSTKKR